MNRHFQATCSGASQSIGCLLLRPGRGVEYCDQPICLSTSISLELLDCSAQNFVCRSPVAMAWSSSGGIALRYVLLIVWMMSCLAIMDAMSKGGGSTRHRWSITCATEEESDVYGCLLYIYYLDCTSKTKSYTRREQILHFAINFSCQGQKGQGQIVHL